MRNRFSQITIAAIGILFYFSLFSSFVFAGSAVPFNEESVVKELKDNIESLQLEYFNNKGDPGVGIDYVLFIKEIHMEAFNRCGYDFSATISKMANEGYNKEDIIFKEIISILIIQVTYSVGGETDVLYELFNKTGARNLLKIMLVQNATEQNRDLPDYNLYERDEIDSLLREKWKKMTDALRNGNIEEALKYFISAKRPAYKEIFTLSSGKIKYIIETTKNMEIVDFDFYKVKYVVDFKAIVDGNQRTMSSYIIFVRDEDGLWKINFF